MTLVVVLDRKAAIFLDFVQWKLSAGKIVIEFTYNKLDINLVIAHFLR